MPLDVLRAGADSVAMIGGLLPPPRPPSPCANGWKQWQRLVLPGRSPASQCAGYNRPPDYVIFAVLLFYMLTISGLFVLRRTRPIWTVVNRTTRGRRPSPFCWAYTDYSIWRGKATI